jgi:hypothetical protein
MDKGESLDQIFSDLSEDISKRVRKKLDEFSGRRVSFYGTVWVDKYHYMRNKWTRFEVTVDKIEPNGGRYIPYQLKLIDDKGNIYTLGNECEILILS